MAFAKIARSMVRFATRPMSSLATAIPQVLSTPATVERRLPPLYNFQFLRQSVILPNAARYSSMGECINMIDPTTLDNLLDFIDLNATGYNLDNIKECYPIFDKMNKVLESSTTLVYDFIFNVVKERVEHHSKDIIQKLVDQAFMLGFVYVGVLINKAAFGEQFGNGTYVKGGMGVDSNGGKGSEGNGGKGSNADDDDGKGSKDASKEHGVLPCLTIIQDSYLNFEKVERLVLSTFASREGTRSIPADVETVSDISGCEHNNRELY